MVTQMIAPVIARLIEGGLNLLANAVKSKGEKYIEEKLNIDLSKNSLEKLENVQLANEEFLLKIAIEQGEQNLKEIELLNANTANARQMNSNIQNNKESSWLSKNAAYVLDFFIVLSTISLSVVLFYTTIPEQNKEMLYLALGSLITMSGTILNFHRGTSSSSAKKNDIIERLQK